LLTLTLVGCATTKGGPTYSGIKGVAEFRLVHSTTSPAVNALTQRFYQGPFSTTVSEQEVQALLTRHPHNGQLHGVAAHLAELNADPKLAYVHHMQAAADLENPHAALHLWQAHRGNRLVSETKASIAFFERVQKKHPDPNVRSYAAWLTLRWAPRFFELKKARAATTALAPLQKFWVAGAFDNDQGKGFHEAYPPELGVAPQAAMKGMRVPVKWRRAEASDLDGVLHLASHISPSSQALAYALTRFSIAQNAPAQLRITTSDPIRVWVDGELVISEERVEGFDLDNIVVPVPLKAGKHTLLIKSANQSGRWRLMVRLTQPNGQNLAVKSLSQNLPALPGVKPKAAQALTAPMSGHAARGDQAFAQNPHASALDLSRRGFPLNALAEMQKVHDAWPDNAWTLAGLIAAHQKNGESEKAIDLVGEAVALTQEKTPLFLMRRARFLEQKEQEDQAEADLRRVIALNPDARVARMALANLFSRRSFDADACRILQ
jgi:hypothetical protein